MRAIDLYKELLCFVLIDKVIGFRLLMWRLATKILTPGHFCGAY